MDSLYTLLEVKTAKTIKGKTLPFSQEVLSMPDEEEYITNSGKNGYMELNLQAFS